MTEFWVSQANKWCDYCKCWLKDSAQSWAVHERGIKHQENVARKLREMRLKQDKEKKDEESLTAELSKVDQEAKRRYEEDRKEEEAARKARLGEWVWNEGSGYFYNAAHRWYYDTKTKMYYGGDPVNWTDQPSLPHEARYEVMTAPPPQRGAAAARPAGGRTAAAAAGRPAATQQYAVAGGKVMAHHPLAQVGGYQLHSVQGAVGGAKGVGMLSGGGKAAVGGSDKRKRDGDGGKELSKEDRDFLARREAAQQRVQQRTAASFGLT